MDKRDGRDRVRIQAMTDRPGVPLRPRIARIARLRHVMMDAAVTLTRLPGANRLPSVDRASGSAPARGLIEMYGRTAVVAELRQLLEAALSRRSRPRAVASCPAA
jgi:hypothetical protein